jgi:hypothetical protein
MAIILRFVVEKMFRLESELAHKKKHDYPVSRCLCSYTEDCLICYLTFRRRNNRQHESTVSSSGRWLKKYHCLFEGSWFCPLVLPLKVVFRFRWAILRRTLVGWSPKKSEDNLSSCHYFHSLWGQRLNCVKLGKVSEYYRRKLKVLFLQPFVISGNYPLVAGSQFGPLIFLVRTIFRRSQMCCKD